jgi:NAD(P)-dependent dehydrogenase (short-subunit alcohol dehydrogenase family)
MADFSAKTVCITGAGSGIGRQSAIAFSQAGANVVVADLNADGLSETIAACGPDAATHMVVADASREDDVAGLIAECQDQFGDLHVFCANAGVSGTLKTIDKVEIDEIEHVIRVNLIGPMLAVKHAGPAIAQSGGGAIVLTASVAGLKANSGPLLYSATKAGVISIAQSGAQELAGTNVRVNAICPGLIETGMTQFVFDRARAKGTDGRLGQLNPTSRPGVPSDIADVVVFLASDEASYVNGHAMVVDGGLTSSAPFAPNNTLRMNR